MMEYQYLYIEDHSEEYEKYIQNNKNEKKVSIIEIEMDVQEEVDERILNINM